MLKLQTPKFIKKRDGRIVNFDSGKILKAVYKAMQATKEGDLSGRIARDPQRVTEAILKNLEQRAKKDKNYIPDIEEIQDLVEVSLFRLDFAKTARAYITYRNQRALLRDKKRLIPNEVKKMVKGSRRFFKNDLGEFTYYRSYSRWMPEANRRETWLETVGRYMDFMKENLGDKLSEGEYEEIRLAILNQQVMPSMRLMWSAGKAARVSNVVAYNCSYVAPSRLEDFAEIMYLSMCGCGVGFSVESQTVQQLPIVRRQSGVKLDTHVISDDKEGWCDALTLGLKTRSEEHT